MHQGGFVPLVLKRLLFGGEYRLGDVVRWMRGQFFSITAMQQEMQTVDLFRQIPEVQVPVAFCTGRHDYTTPFELAERYFEQLNAPDKKWQWFEDSAHSPIFEQPEQFAEFVQQTVEEWKKRTSQAEELVVSSSK